jgi:hypothetical protein
MPPHLGQPGRPAQDGGKIGSRVAAFLRHDGHGGPAAGSKEKIE